MKHRNLEEEDPHSRLLLERLPLFRCRHQHHCFSIRLSSPLLSFSFSVYTHTHVCVYIRKRISWFFLHPPSHFCTLSLSHSPHFFSKASSSSFACAMKSQHCVDDMESKGVTSRTKISWLSSLVCVCVRCWSLNEFFLSQSVKSPPPPTPSLFSFLFVFVWHRRKSSKDAPTDDQMKREIKRGRV